MMPRNVVQGVRSILLNPKLVRRVNRALDDRSYHGRLSSASIGRLAALLLPLALVLSELKVIAFEAGGASTSISSS